MCKDCGCSVKDIETVEVNTKILDKNDKQANANRQHFAAHGIFAINLMSSPGSGKTTLIEKTIDHLNGESKIGVIEGDLETNRDAERIRAKGVPAHQISTGQACHLDAFMVHEGIHNLPLDLLDMVFVENVGNLVCPASYDLGTHLNVVLLSSTEGDDKPAKYPIMFRKADLMLITKTDLVQYIDFDPRVATEEARKINPEIEVIEISSKTGEGLEDWVNKIKCV
jgi:hydrogenase nickel incorporation protein HypB